MAQRPCTHIAQSGVELTAGRVPEHVRYVAAEGCIWAPPAGKSGTPRGNEALCAEWFALRETPPRNDSFGSLSGLVCLRPSHRTYVLFLFVHLTGWDSGTAASGTLCSDNRRCMEPHQSSSVSPMQPFVEDTVMPKARAVFDVKAARPCSAAS